MVPSLWVCGAVSHSRHPNRMAVLVARLAKRTKAWSTCGARTEHVRSTYGARTKHVRSTLGKTMKSVFLPDQRLRDFTSRIFELSKVCISWFFPTCSVRAPYVLRTCSVRAPYVLRLTASGGGRIALMCRKILWKAVLDDVDVRDCGMNTTQLTSGGRYLLPRCCCNGLRRSLHLGR